MFNRVEEVINASVKTARFMSRERRVSIAAHKNVLKIKAVEGKTFNASNEDK